MKLSTRFVRRAALASAAAAGAAVLLSPGAAFAATDDSFTVKTTNGCGSVEFVDYGPGAAGGGNNDDYLVIHDYCSDGHGVTAFSTVNNGEQKSEYNGNGLAGAAVIWDPFAPRNINAGDTIKLKVCLFDGPADETGQYCKTVSKTSVDG
ncbi:hypothetical protein [Actinoplanes friuliensis]|jgi:hypothetical protein|uniref:Secreted protein n=1 Tax=Actinoplanes friuliensis DSM 7358 TaxID=1246995 RepID=U5VWW2_9ACTN|nr:hypothetical protein [Actinoplanes friuliensis]AGZ40126.1 hypothetical protein AFR_09185 [Actinoplanes friuliensis DSM 7358]